MKKEKEKPTQVYMGFSAGLNFGCGFWTAGFFTLLALAVIAALLMTPSLLY
jgi:hypothetical protein